MRTILLLAMAYLLGLASPACWAGPQVQWEQYFDETGALELPEVQSRPFAPATAFVHWKATPGTVWLRFRLPDLTPTDDGRQPLLLLWNRPTTDRVSIYLPSSEPSGQGSAWRERTLSAHELLDGARLGGGSDLYPLPQTFYVRLQTQGWHLIEPRVLMQSEFEQSQETAALLLSTNLSLGLLALFGAAAQWVVTRRMAYAGLALLSIGWLGLYLNLEGVFVNGLGLEPYAFVTITNVSLMLSILASPFFAAAVLSASTEFVCGRRALHWYIGIALVLLAATPFAWRVVVFALAMALNQLFCAYLVWKRYQTKGAEPFFPWHTRVDTAMAVSLVLVNFFAICIYFGSTWLPRIANEKVAFSMTAHGALYFLFGLAFLLRQDYARRVKTASAIAAARSQHEAHEQWRATQQQFLAMLVHEIRTPLTVIQFGNHAMARRALDPAQKTIWVQRMDGAVATIRQILENCVHADRMDAGAQTVQMAEFAIAPVLQSALEGLQERDALGAERLELCYETEALRDVRCQADSAYVAIILANLLSNALKYSPAGSPVRLLVHTRQQNDQQWLALSIHNEVGESGGPDPARLFERYYRAQSSGRVAGTGLGLWLCQALAQQMQTEITFEQFGQHIRFGLVLLQAPLDRP